MAGASKDPTARVEALDLLRLVAVAGVILYHYGFRGPSVGGYASVAIPGLSQVAMYGYLGVPAFFIISGFVIAYSAAGRTATGFAIARFARIYPTFVLCMTLTSIAVLMFGRPAFETDIAQWGANLLVASPLLGQPYMDGAYWSLVIEITFYIWVSVLIAMGLFPRRVDAIVLTWLCVSMANELTFDSRWVERVFLADDSGFFAVGLMMYEHYRGRRDAVLYCIFALSIGTAVFQANHNLAWLQHNAGDVFRPAIVSAICLTSIVIIFLATRLRRLPLPAGLMVALGGLTYPLYLLHMQLGYAIVMYVRPEWRAATAGVCLAGIVGLSWAIWRYVERPLQRWLKASLTAAASRLGWASRQPGESGRRSIPATPRVLS